MDKNISRLEWLPNETFIELFQYFDVQELFQAFNNLNFRFNTLIRSLNILIFKLWENNYYQMNGFLPYIDTLVIQCQTPVNLRQLENIRRLSLISLTAYVWKQLNTNTLPSLEHLSVKKVSSNHADIFYNKIFSNTFPHLKSCYVSQDNKITANEWIVHLPVLCFLQIGIIDLLVYKAILSGCPNLNAFKFRLISSEISVVVKPHVNLKRMTIKSEDFTQSKNDYAVNICLSFVPNLERLIIHQDFFQVNTPQYLKCDWHASSIARHLPSLRRFNYYFKTWYLIGIDPQVINIFDEMKRNFRHVHNDRYQSQLLLNLTC